jgi:hypothetical protein
MSLRQKLFAAEGSTRQLTRLGVAVASLMCVLPLRAAVVVVDFEGITPTYEWGNLVVNGFSL